VAVAFTSYGQNKRPGLKKAAVKKKVKGKKSKAMSSQSLSVANADKQFEDTREDIKKFFIKQ